MYCSSICSAPFLIDQPDQRIAHRLGTAVVVQPEHDPVEVAQEIIR